MVEFIYGLAMVFWLVALALMGLITYRLVRLFIQARRGRKP